ncbi:3671_t:CDS:1, partial [Scutellospora calospora]
MAKNEKIFTKENIGLEDIFVKGTFRFDDLDKNMKSRINQDDWELMTAIDTPIDVDELKDNKSKCSCSKPFWHDFSVYVYISHTNKGQKNESQGMPYGVKKVDTDKNIIVYCCDKDTVTNSNGYQPNTIWVLTVTFDPVMMRKRIERSLSLPNIKYDNDITFFGREPILPTHSGPFLILDKVIPIMAYDTNMDSVTNLKITSQSAMQQLVDAVKAAIENPDGKPNIPLNVPIDPNSV